MAIMPAINTNPYQSPFNGLDKIHGSHHSNCKNVVEPLIQVFVSHVGDCRAVLSCNDGVVVQLTEDHKASNKAEKLRIEAAKGNALQFTIRYSM